MMNNFQDRIDRRIKQLAEQAGYSPLSPPTFADELNEIFMRKFAEAIVRECLAQADTIRDGCEADGEDEQALGADWVGLAISRHFGVE
jgi:hypothetical protein